MHDFKMLIWMSSAKGGAGRHVGHASRSAVAPRATVLISAHLAVTFCDFSRLHLLPVIPSRSRSLRPSTLGRALNHTRLFAAPQAQRAAAASTFRMKPLARDRSDLYHLSI